ncbi:hypothetical protein [Paeniglutamicibacter kerguelensis]|uniref:Flp pilus-assembly TadG-like N-terminal domain-containing protein n=1 Tax=Paeniglutamicibacter kerguelensis TaxID=254788 RepID=A0ABS4XAS0_9MICC|nr:hypothetical protein [Paeniglutamicibacter kerguelensis]MBP2385343.1 hypothetical protein [Paeniglutamicibacter kerguelensis]
MGSPGASRRDATGHSSRRRGGCRIRTRAWEGSNADAEAGQSIILIIGMIALALLTISVVLAATAVNVQARKLLSVADGAVAAAADNFELDATGQSEASLRLNPAEVRAAAGKYLDDIGAGADFADLRIVSAGVQGDGLTAHLRLGAVVHPPIFGWVVPTGVGISVESKARTLLSR